MPAFWRVWVQGLGKRVWVFRVQGLGLEGFWGSGFGVQGLGLEGLGFRV